MDKNIYKTKQKETIYTFIAQNPKEHFTALKLAENLKKSGFSIGTATVYRHLDNFVKNGLVNKYVLDNENSAIYEYIGNNAQDPQFHFKCDVCGKLNHVECSFVENIKKHLLQDHQFNLDITKTVFYGKCTQCS